MLSARMKEQHNPPLSELLLEFKRADVGSPTASYRAAQIEKIFEELLARVVALEEHNKDLLGQIEKQQEIVRQKERENWEYSIFPVDFQPPIP